MFLCLIFLLTSAVMASKGENPQQVYTRISVAVHLKKILLKEKDCVIQVTKLKNTDFEVHVSPSPLFMQSPESWIRNMPPKIPTVCVCVPTGMGSE